MHEHWDYKEWPALNLLVVVPTAGRLATLEDALAEVREDGKTRGYPFFTAWGMYAATAEDLTRQGPLAYVWWPLTDRGPARALTELTPRGPGADPGAVLGRRWRHNRPDFWPRLSPLGRAPARLDLRLSGTDGLMPDPQEKEGSWD